jgi:sugar lactone lactonase YvrE
MKQTTLVVLGWLTVLAPVSTFANDSIAHVGAGGLELLKSDDIQMVSETLEISTSKIKVKYHFLNTSNREIKTTVAFPMPPYGYNPGFSQNERNIAPFTSVSDFAIKVDGIVVNPQSRLVAEFDGKDVTGQLRKIGLTDDQIFRTFGDCHVDEGSTIGCNLTENQEEAISNLSGQRDEYGPLTAWQNRWKIAETAYWEQTFPAGKVIEVSHQYTPLTGIRAKSKIGEDGCPNEGSQQAIDRIAEKNANEQFYTEADIRQVDYILGTGRNWNGPIKDFRLIISKDTSTQIISLCFPGNAKRTSPTTLEFHQKNFVPQDRLAVYFVTVSRGEKNQDGPLFQPAREPILTESQLLLDTTLQEQPTITLFAGYKPLAKPTYIDDLVTNPTKVYSAPNGLTVDGQGNLYSMDGARSRIIKFTANGVVSDFAGADHMGSGKDVDGPRNVAKFSGALDLAIDNANNIYVPELTEGIVRKVTPDGTVSTLFNGEPASYYNPKLGLPVLRKYYNDGELSSAKLTSPSYIAVDKSGNSYVADNGSYLVRKISTNGIITTLAGSPFKAGDEIGSGSKASFRRISGIAVDSRGNVYISESESNRIRKISQRGLVTEFAGNGIQSGKQDGIGIRASFYHPKGLAVDLHDNVYVADTGNNLIRRISPTGVVKTIVGNGKNKLVTGPLPGGINNPVSLAISGDRLYILTQYQYQYNYIAVVSNLHKIQ